MIGKIMRYLPAAAIGVLAAVAMAPDARAQAVPGSMSVDYSKNANKPIDITAEVLEVDDKKKIAIFKGSVTAIQGDFNMKSRELVVYYSAGSGGGPKKVAVAAQGAGDAPVAPTAAASPLPGGSSEITRIEAKGDVLLTTKDSQECRGDTALYQVKEQLVTIQGNVRVAKGPDNVIKGEKMVVNLATSTTTFDNSSGVNPGRISVILQPKEKDKDKEKAKKQEAEKEKPE